MELFLAIDGGGTSCKAAITDASGVILGRATVGPANIQTNPTGAATNVQEATIAALKDAGHPDYPLERLSAFLGLAGGNVVDKPAFAARLSFAETYVEDDQIIALEGALGNNDGIVAVLGTGSVFLARYKGHVRRVGGWGFKLGDLGSAARLGQALFQEALLAHDGITEPSTLTKKLMDEFGNPAKISAFAHNEPPATFARYAPWVFEAADQNDPIARRLVLDASAHVQAALSALFWPECSKLCLLGGISRFHAPLLSPEFGTILTAPKGDALSGAIALALRRFGGK